MRRITKTDPAVNDKGSAFVTGLWKAHLLYDV